LRINGKRSGKSRDGCAPLRPAAQTDRRMPSDGDCSVPTASGEKGDCEGTEQQAGECQDSENLNPRSPLVIGILWKPNWENLKKTRR
jgi:hypothetical protein